MSTYNFIPFVNGKLDYESAFCCVNCANINEAVERANNLKRLFGYKMVTITKHITQV